MHFLQLITRAHFKMPYPAAEVRRRNKGICQPYSRGNPASITPHLATLTGLTNEADMSQHETKTHIIRICCRKMIF